MASEYTAEDYISFIEQGRRDKISPHALELIAARFRYYESENQFTYKVGMMQGFRMLQSFLSIEQQKKFGFQEKEKINDEIEKQYKQFKKEINENIK